jgi:hypothetical protein
MADGDAEPAGVGVFSISTFEAAVVGPVVGISVSSPFCHAFPS